MFTENVPKHILGEAGSYCSLSNQQATSSVISYRTPNIQLPSHGLVYFAHNHELTRGKLDPRALKAYLLAILITKRGTSVTIQLIEFFVSMDITFHETQPF